MFLLKIYQILSLFFNIALRQTPELITQNRTVRRIYIWSHPITFPSFTSVTHVSMVLNIYLILRLSRCRLYVCHSRLCPYLSAYTVVSPDIKQIAVSHSAFQLLIRQRTCVLQANYKRNSLFSTTWKVIFVFKDILNYFRKVSSFGLTS